MNCCSDYGQCTQGHNCAAHTVPLATASRTCESMGVCNMHPSCTHLGDCAAQLAAIKAVSNSPTMMHGVLEHIQLDQASQASADYWARTLIAVGFFALGLLGGLLVLPRL